MAKKVFRDYAEINEKLMEGFTVASVSKGINAEESGMLLELERRVDNVVLGIDISFDPEHKENETILMVSDEYVKSIDWCAEKKVCQRRSVLENSNDWPLNN